MARTYAEPKETGLRRGEVEHIAEEVAKQLGLSPGADLVSALSEIGGTIKYRDFRNLFDSDSGSLLVHAEENFEIIISKQTSPLRDRFTIAHELGHYVLHYLYPRQHSGGPENLQATRYGSDRAEWEANWFAAAFLMPRKAFKTAFRQTDRNIDAVAEQFGVSRAAADVRAKVLGLQ